MGVLLGLGGWTAFKLVGLLITRQQFLPLIDSIDYIRLLLDQLRPFGWLVMAVSVLMWVHCRTISHARLSWAALATVSVLQAASFSTTVHPSLRQHTLRFGPEVQFVRQYLHDHPSTRKALPTIYAYWGRSDHVWIDLRVKSYFHGDQIAGVLFNRETAVEGRRRALVVGPFELDRLEEMEWLLSEVFRPYFRRLFGANDGASPPTRTDLERLCQDGIADLAILRQEFPGLPVATDGRAYIYEYGCRRVRGNL